MILEVQNGCFGYPKQPVILENINLRLEEGHILATLGPNGIGKTTLLKCMIGLLPWHSGKALFYHQSQDSQRCENDPHDGRCLSGLEASYDEPNRQQVRTDHRWLWRFYLP